ncbi:MAG TPA: hypothetical protein PKH07_19695, partial [bacterium]|nr:hypothetical protein [bacterium]
MKNTNTRVIVTILLSVCCHGAFAATPLERCGYQTLRIVMEQLPNTSDWLSWYNENNDAMWVYNQHMDIYGYVAADGSWGQNYKNEFGGWPSDTELHNLWGYNWGDAVAMTVWVWESQCGRIKETDIIFNPSYTWTTDPLAAEGNSSVLYYTSILYHEMGHSWGLQTRNETYDYDVPTVMHYYKSSMVQDVHTIHTPDAKMLRENYSNQTSAPDRLDMGVHSKNAQGTWQNASTNKRNYIQGEPLSVYGMLVENVGNKGASNVRLRFYLSENRTISVSDYLIDEWSWGSFAKATWSVFNFENMTIPSDIPAGNYYVGALISVDGYSQDDLYDN